MRKTDLVRFQRIFEEQRSQLLSNTTFADEDFLIRQEDKDEVDQANADIAQNMRMHLKNRETGTLRLISDALRRIQEGTFGECNSCGENIELRRLKAKPTAILCIPCKEEEEKHRASSVLGHRFQTVH